MDLQTHALEVNPGDPIPGEIVQDDPAPGDYGQDDPAPGDDPGGDLIDAAGFHAELFCTVHAAIEWRVNSTGRELDLSELAMSARGKAASDVFYRVFNRYSFLRETFLRPGGSMIADVMTLAIYAASVSTAIKTAPLAVSN